MSVGTERAARAAARAEYPGEVIRSGDPKPPLYAGLTLTERLARMTALCRAQWIARGWGDLGHASSGVARRDLLGSSWMTSSSDRILAICLLTSISGVTFDEAYAGRLFFELEGRRIPFIGRAALLANKRAAGRAKDLADVEWLEREA